MLSAAQNNLAWAEEVRAQGMNENATHATWDDRIEELVRNNVNSERPQIGRGTFHSNLGLRRGATRGKTSSFLALPPATPLTG